MSCEFCKRTFKGLIWYLWGEFWIRITFLCGIKMYLENNNSKLGAWLVSQYGYARNQYWPSKHEIKSCSCRDN